ncbi:MAG: hypothetical protein NTV76_15405, partial [Pseudomonas sp.]|nr:hypothetical protein [Pseudomonas sp.]
CAWFNCGDRWLIIVDDAAVTCHATNNQWQCFWGCGIDDDIIDRGNGDREAGHATWYDQIAAN